MPCCVPVPTGVRMDQLSSNLVAAQRHHSAVSHHLLGAYQKSLVEVIRAQQGLKAAPGGLAVRTPRAAPSGASASSPVQVKELPDPFL